MDLEKNTERRRIRQRNRNLLIIVIILVLLFALFAVISARKDVVLSPDEENPILHRQEIADLESFIDEMKRNANPFNWIPSPSGYSVHEEETHKN